jgi:hypothetical protein
MILRNFYVECSLYRIDLKEEVGSIIVGLEKQLHQTNL